jgi:hypothetical protein
VVTLEIAGDGWRLEPNWVGDEALLKRINEFMIIIYDIK